MSIVELTQDNFDQTIEDNDIVIIDFWAEWCQPCLQFASTYQAVAEQHPGIVFGKINIEEQPELAADFNVRSIPLLMVIRQSVAIFSEAGTMPQSMLNDLIEQAKALDMEQIKNAMQEQSDQT